MHINQYNRLFLFSAVIYHTAELPFNNSREIGIVK